MKEIVNFYKCLKCGNVIEITDANINNITCCEEKMVKLEANSVDASKEKHVPVVEKNDGELLVKIGSTLHPMSKEHYIMWVAAVQDNKVNKVVLSPEQDPIVRLPFMAKGTVYIYCNLHGLWKTEF